MAKGHCELVCDISIVDAAYCVKCVNAATERFSMIINYLLHCANKVVFLNLKRSVHFWKVWQLLEKIPAEYSLFTLSHFRQLTSVQKIRMRAVYKSQQSIHRSL